MKFGNHSFMSTRLFGKPIKRNEDPRLLTGQAQFVDDVHLPGTLHVAFLRSAYAHARLKLIDTSAAQTLPGVVAIYTADDLGDYWQPGPLLVPPPPIKDLVFNPRTQVPLAKDKVRHAGEPIVVIVAESRYIAEDAAQLISVEYEPLKAVVDLEDALKPGATVIHDDLAHNLNAHVIQQKGDYEAAKAKADVVIKRRFLYDRGTAAAMENRGIVASWDAQSEQLTMWDTTQAPIAIRNGIAAMLGLSEKQVRVIAPFIGGGFGPKIMMFYPEEVLLAWITKQLNRPVKWIEDRQENFYATTQERGQIHEAEMALSKDGKILGVRDWFLHDAGAYAPYGLTVPINSQCTLLGQYEVPNYYSEFRSVFTNKPIVTPYRGAGRQHGVFVMERLLDHAAKELGIDRVEIRKRNLIPPDQFPYNNQIIFQDFAPLIYDSGNYLPAIEKALAMIDYQNFIEHEQPRLRAEGKRVGLGFVTYVEGTGIGPYEGAKGDGGDQRTGERRHRHRHAGAGALHRLCPGRGRATGRRSDRCAADHGRHQRVLLGRGNLCQPWCGGGGQCDPRRLAQSARQDPQKSRRRVGSCRRRPRIGRWHGACQGFAAECDQAGRSGTARQPDAWRSQAGHASRDWKRPTTSAPNAAQLPAVCMP